ncbi:MAG: hypothetical protein IT439_03310 [Phycisphaerales bacterium]|nr:hypothetical protein [Phycisphaerales bacterium]
MTRRRLARGGWVVGGITAIGLALTGASAQNAPVRAPQPQLTQRHSTSPVYEAWVPPGAYTALVISSSGENRQWPVALRTKSQRVPIIVRPGENVVIPFEGGWKIEADELVRFESDRVPFFDHSLLDPLDGLDTFVLTAWGVTKDGPVALVSKPEPPEWLLERANIKRPGP